MTGYQQTKGALGLVVSPEADAACRFLESRGQQFLIQFGTANAFEIAVALMEAELRLEIPGKCIYCGEPEEESCLPDCEQWSDWMEFTYPTTTPSTPASGHGRRA